jgi:hypothetical protein
MSNQMIRSHRSSRQVIIGGLALLCVVGAALAGEQGEEPLTSTQSELLSTVTGIHSVFHKKSGFEVRVLEADGSASVAQNPISLYLIVTNSGSADHLVRVWRLRQSVERVRRLTPTACGIDLHVDVNGEAEHGRAFQVPRVLHLSFLSNGRLERLLKTSEAAR